MIAETVFINSLINQENHFCFDNSSLAIHYICLLRTFVKDNGRNFDAKSC